jgi:hypothetical protein
MAAATEHADPNTTTTTIADRVVLLEQRADSLAASFKASEGASVSAALLERRVKALEATSSRLEDAAARLQQAATTNTERRLAALEARLRGVSNLAGRLMALDAVALELGVAVPLAEPPPLPSAWGDGAEAGTVQAPLPAGVKPVVLIDGTAVPSKTKQELTAMQTALEIERAEACNTAKAVASLSARLDEIAAAVAAAERCNEARTASTSAALDAISARVDEVSAVAASASKALARARDGESTLGFAEYCKLESRVAQAAADGANALRQAQDASSAVQSNLAELKAGLARALKARDADRALQASAADRLRADLEALAARIARVESAAAVVPPAAPPPPSAAAIDKAQRQGGRS